MGKPLQIFDHVFIEKFESGFIQKISLCFIFFSKLHSNVSDNRTYT